MAAHYDHVNVALLLLESNASPHATAKNGYTPLHIAAKKNQMDIATTLLKFGAKANAESKAGFTPLHLASQEGHTDMTSLLMAHQGNVDAKAKVPTQEQKTSLLDSPYFYHNMALEPKTYPTFLTFCDLLSLHRMA